MKKHFLCLLTVLCLTLALVPAVFAEEAENADLQAQITAAAAGGTITLTGDVTLTSPLTIDKALVIDGTAQKYAITYAGADVNAVIIKTNSAVTLKNLTLNATQSGGRGVMLDTSKPNFTLTNSVLNADTRGIWVSQDDTEKGTRINVLNSTIQNSRKPAAENYETWSHYGDSRGISLWDMTAATVNIQNSHIYGFGYTINLSGNNNEKGVCSFSGTTVTVNNSDLFGWTAFNVWSSDTKFIITNSHLRGINLSTGSSDSFDTIVVNDDIYNQFDGATAEACEFVISGGIIDNHLPESTLEAAANGESVCIEGLFRIDKQGVTKATLKNDVHFIDQSNLLQAAFSAGNEPPTIEFYNYVYGLEEIKRINPESYTSTYADGGDLPLAVLPGGEQ